MDPTSKMMSALVDVIESQVKLIARNNDVNQKKMLAETINLLSSSYKHLTESVSTMYGTLKDFDDEEDDDFLNFMDMDAHGEDDDNFDFDEVEMQNKIKNFKNPRSSKSKKGKSEVDEDAPF